MNSRGYKSIINQIELAYCPMSNYTFSVLKNDIAIQRALEESHLYIIAQQPVLSFENIVPDKNEKLIRFEIHKKDSYSVLKCELPFFQENLATNSEYEVILYVGSNDPNYVKSNPPLNNIHGIKFYEMNLSNENFLVWFSPEKFIHNWLKGYFIAKVDGNYQDFLDYKVHYVGKATEQDIWKRLTGHSTLQDILSVEYPFTYGELPTHEITLLLFRFYDNLEIKTYGTDSSIDDMVNSLLGKNRPDKKEIFLDAEKALVNAMQPKYNKIKFKNYPNYKKGLNELNYDTYSYTFMDPITLKFNNGKIKGGLNNLGGDLILVKNNKIEVLKT